MRSRRFNINPYIPRSLQKRIRYSLIYLILFVLLLAAVVGLYKGGVHIAQLKPEQITIGELPYALALSFVRMLASYFVSLILAYILGLLAARFVMGEKLIIPLLDIFQSVPVVGFFPAAFTFFISLSHGHRIGVEMAAVFLIFTSQAWNMAFSVYESTKTIPQDNFDAVTCFGVSGSQRFWKLYAPASIPRLVYNSILSWSNGWYFLVACEIIAVGPVRYYLPGIGSFLARAAEQDQVRLVIWGIVALSALILSLDFILWRPVSIWSEKFRQEYAPSDFSPRSDTRTRMVRYLSPRLRPFRVAFVKMGKVLLSPWIWGLKEIILPLLWDLPASVSIGISKQLYTQIAKPTLHGWNTLVKKANWIQYTLFWTLGTLLGVSAGVYLIRWSHAPWPEISKEIPMAILKSTGRLIIALGISLLITLPLTLLSWNRPKLRQALTTFSQLGASIPATALFPLIILIAVHKFGGGMELSSLFLLLTGMIWYVLFNGMGGASTIPNDLSEATRAFGLSRFQIWKRLVLPALRPALITGMITAWGGGWNALVLAEYVTYKDQIFSVKGIGALLSRSVYQLGDQRSITICIFALVAWVILINTFLWKPLYRSAAERYKFDA